MHLPKCYFSPLKIGYRQSGYNNCFGTSITVFSNNFHLMSRYFKFLKKDYVQENYKKKHRNLCWLRNPLLINDTKTFLIRANFTQGNRAYFSTAAATKDLQVDLVTEDSLESLKSIDSKPFRIPGSLNPKYMFTIPIVQKHLIQHAIDTYNGLGYDILNFFR